MGPDAPPLQLLLAFGRERLRFAQTHRDRIEVRLQAARPLTDEEARGVVDWARAKFGDPFRIELAFPAELARTAAGKFEDFICLL